MPRKVHPMAECDGTVPRWWYLGLGSNLGDRERFLTEAIRRIALIPGTTVEAISSLYESAPWGDEEQPPFLNMVVRIRCPLEPLELLAEVKRIERDVGRQPRRRWGPREIDIDLLLAEGLRIETRTLIVPHPLISARQFVLIPLAELDPELRLPDGSTVSTRVVRNGSVRLWRARDAAWSALLQPPRAASAP